MQCPGGNPTVRLRVICGDMLFTLDSFGANDSASSEFCELPGCIRVQAGEAFCQQKKVVRLAANDPWFFVRVTLQTVRGVRLSRYGEDIPVEERNTRR